MDVFAILTRAIASSAGYRSNGQSRSRRANANSAGPRACGAGIAYCAAGHSVQRTRYLRIGQVQPTWSLDSTVLAQEWRKNIGVLYFGCARTSRSRPTNGERNLSELAPDRPAELVTAQHRYPTGASTRGACARQLVRCPPTTVAFARKYRVAAASPHGTVRPAIRSALGIGRAQQRSAVQCSVRIGVPQPRRRSARCLACSSMSGPNGPSQERRTTDGRTGGERVYKTYHLLLCNARRRQQAVPNRALAKQSEEQAITILLGIVWRLA